MGIEASWAQTLEKMAVKADVDHWQKSGIKTFVGEVIDIDVTGQWSFNCRRNPLGRNIHVHSSPDGKCLKCQKGKSGWPADRFMPLPHAPTGALIGKIKDKVFMVGKHLHLVITPDLVGDLQFMMNDSNFMDNHCFYQDSLDIPKEFSHLDIKVIHTEYR